MALTEPQTFTCESCGAEHTTDSLRDLAQLGWVRHSQRGTFFLMCPRCETLSGSVWSAREIAGRRASTVSKAFDHLCLACKGKGLTIEVTLGKPRRDNADAYGREIGNIVVRRGPAPVVSQDAGHVGIDRAAQIVLSKLLATVK